MTPTTSKTKRSGQHRPPSHKRSRISDATIQLEQRRRQRRHRRMVQLTVALVTMAIVAAGVWLTGFSSVLAVHKIEVSGTARLSREAVRQAARVPIGRPILRTNLQQLTDRTESLAPVESATASRVWPDGIRITVRERTAVYAVSQQGSGAVKDYLLVDRHGVGFASVAQPPKGLLVAEVRTTDSAVLSDFAVVVTTLPESLRKRVTAISAASPDTIELSLNHGGVLRWGSAQESELKAKVAVALLHHKARIYDVTAPGQPATR